MMASGRIVKLLGKVKWFGQMDSSMMEIGTIINLKVKEQWNMLLVRYMKVSGKIIYLKD